MVPGPSRMAPDLHDAVAMARRGNPETLSGAMAWGLRFRDAVRSTSR